VKAKDKNPRPEGSGKQQKQLLVLGGLVAVLGVVVAVQFGGSDPAAGAAALSAPEPGAPVAAAAAAPAAPVAVAAPEPATPAVADNPVLSQPVEDTGLTKSPFANFWNVAKGADPAIAGAAVPELAPPSVTLSATMPSATRALAVIDGEMRFVGDLIEGWELAEIQPRRIVLRSPGKATFEVEMPLLSGARALPGAGADG